VKADVRRPITYGAVVASLLAFRVWWARSRARVPAPAAARVQGVGSLFL
jgi:DMSO/TMAO reductase YedYZ heme-binding membrane subunit